MMKTTVSSIALAVIFLLSVSGLLAGHFSGSDDFSGASIDTNKWNINLIPSGFGAFTQANNRLELDLDGDGTDFDGYLPWIEPAPYSQDWEVNYDVGVSSFSASSDEIESGMGIVICTPAMDSRRLMLILRKDNYDVIPRKFVGSIKSGEEENYQDLATSTVTASLKVSWDASEASFSCLYDEDGGANSWATLANWDIGSESQYTWNMTTGDTFLCILMGIAEVDKEGEPRPYGDNFIASLIAPAAPLAIFRPSSGLWALRNITRAYFGASSDTPVYSDYDGDGTKDIAIFRGSSGLWAIRGITRAYFGGSSDDPVPGDFNDDGISDIAIFRESSGLWAVRGLTRGYYGTTGDIPLEP